MSFALRRLMLAGSDISYLVGQYEVLCNANNPTENVQLHEHNNKKHKTFLDKLLKLHSVLTEMGSFMEGSNKILELYTKCVGHAIAAQLVTKHYKTGTHRFE